MSFSAGDKIRHYQITEQLGQGGMATVYKAHDANLDRYVAIKVMHQATQGDPGFLARFQREAQIVARLRHPHVVTIFEFDQHQGQPYLVMEYIDGETLKDRIKREPYTLDETLETMTAVAQALTYAHERGILHRDIKPSNIMLDRYGVPYLTDFGLARLVAAGESTLSQDMLLGTPQYISPEQAQGIKDLTPATDVYSLGIVLYRLVVGRVPYNADTPYSIVHDHIYKPLPLPSEVNPTVPYEVEQVLLKALAKAPEERYSSANAMMDAFRQAIRDSQLEVLSPASVQIPATESHPAPDLNPKPPDRVIPAVLPTADSDVTPLVSVTIRRQQRVARLWMLSGLGAFVFLCLLGMIILVATLANPYYYSAAEAVATDSPVDSTDAPAQITIRVDISVTDARQWVEDSPRDPIARFTLGLALLEDNNPLQAQEAFTQGIALAGEMPQAIAAAARITAERDFPSIAIPLYTAALSQLPNDAALRNEAGAYLYDEASRATLRDVLVFRRITENYPDFSGAYVMYGRALLAAGQADNAETQIRQALSLAGSLPEAHLVLGEVYAANGQDADASQEWRFAATAADAPAWVIERANTLQSNPS